MKHTHKVSVLPRLEDISLFVGTQTLLFISTLNSKMQHSVMDQTWSGLPLIQLSIFLLSKGKIIKLRFTKTCKSKLLSMLGLQWKASSAGDYWE